MRLAHITDLHFGAEVPAVVAGLLDDVVAQDVDRVLVSGDLTMRARDEQFEAARELLDAIGRPWTSVPGNHDLPLDRLARAYGSLDAYKRIIAPDPEPVVRDGGLLLAGLSSSRPYLWKSGRVDAAQRSFLAAELGKEAELKVLMLHHPLFGATPARGSRAALQVADAAGVDVVLCGHDHISVRQRLGRMIGVISGTACSWRVRGGEPQAWTLLDHEGDRLRITVRHWRDGKFRETDTTEWRRSGDGWHA
ncbi:metallophosphoesterase [Actinoplanes bogorensis]|uniref:Metallophosphoesterase n=1 Tax=Paractinoplanes bogorensis TaxID=1610840 RepID=A0ABS5YKW2_9ACTN|nr:metallophosphoesterase [Actinoplanes bogorensis]MBU2664108.1 metallophosphoesterase [Actinoplanes bogorensis]